MTVEVKKIYHTIQIPVETEKIRDFVRQEGRFAWEKIADQVFKFVAAAFPSFSKVSSLYFGELVKNSYDSYAAVGLRKGERLLLKVVIQQTEEGVTVKFKDNGTGFVKRVKGERFSYDPKTGDIEKGREFLGGYKVGLSEYIQDVKVEGGSVVIKNRKDRGCSVEAFFPHHELSEEEDPLCTIL